MGTPKGPPKKYQFGIYLKKCGKNKLESQGSTDTYYPFNYVVYRTTSRGCDASHCKVYRFSGVCRELLLGLLSLFFKTSKCKKHVKSPHWGGSYITTSCLNWFLSRPIGKVLTVFLHRQNAIPRIRIPRHETSSLGINHFLPDIKQMRPGLSVLLTSPLLRSYHIEF